MKKVHGWDCRQGLNFKFVEANFAFLGVKITQGININTLILVYEEWCSSYSEGGWNNATVQWIWYWEILFKDFLKLNYKIIYLWLYMSSLYY